MRAHRRGIRESGENKIRCEGITGSEKLFTLLIIAQKVEVIAPEDIWFNVENEILPLVDKLPYQRGYDYKVIIGKIHGNRDADAIIEVMFNSMDDLERAAKSDQLKNIIIESTRIFEQGSLRILGAHQT